MITSTKVNPLSGAEQHATALTGDERRIVRITLTILAVLGTGSLVGVASSLYLVNHYPLLLVALSPLGRHLVLVAPIVDPVAFVVVAFVRRMGFYLATFYLGRALGPTGIPWIEARSPGYGRFVRWVERLFERWSYLVVLVGTGPIVSALAGISGMRAPVFLALGSASLLIRLLMILGFAEILRGPIEQILALIDEYWIPGTIVLVIGMAIYQWRQQRSPTAGRRPVSPSDSDRAAPSDR